MWKLIVAASALLSLCNPAFALLRGGGGGIEQAVTTCNINTGVATGLDAGTCASPTAACDNVTDDTAAFASFGTWARATTTNTNGQLIELRVTGTCRFTTQRAYPLAGLRNSRLWGYGASFVSANGSLPSLAVAGVSPSFTPGICHKGLTDAAGCSARINTVSSGATSVTITNTAYCSRFVTGQWAAVTGFDLQGAADVPYGYPPNPAFFDYVQIGSTAACAGSGVIQLQSALTNTYLSTWPNWNSGNSGEADNGGPATIYALDANWGGQADIRGLSIDDTAGNQSIYAGRSVTLRDMTMPGTACIIPSQNKTFSMISSTGASCDIEVDKFIDTMSYSNTTLFKLVNQSASTKTLNWDGGAIFQIGGTPKVANISNTTIQQLRISPSAFGVGLSATCTNCVFGAEALGAGVTENGAGGNGAIPFYTVSGGVFSYPKRVNVTGLAANPGGKLRLTVGSSTGWKTGSVVGKSEGNSGDPLFSSCTGPCVGGATLVVVNGTTIDVTDYNFADVTWSGSGFLYNSAEQTRWAVPGTNFFPTADLGPGLPAYQVTGTTESGGFINIATTLAGSYPTMPPNAFGTSNLQTQLPSWRCINCSGTDQAVGDWSLASSARPMWSYINRTLTNSTALPRPKAIGKAGTIKLNVTNAYTGATNPMRMTFSAFAYIPGSATPAAINWTVNLRQAGLRTITASGVTCDTGGGPSAGACTGDTISLADPAQFFIGDGIGYAKPDGSPVDDTWSINTEWDLNQGVVP